MSQSAFFSFDIWLIRRFIFDILSVDFFSLSAFFTSIFCRWIILAAKLQQSVTILSSSQAPSSGPRWRCPKGAPCPSPPLPPLQPPATRWPATCHSSLSRHCLGGYTILTTCTLKQFRGEYNKYLVRGEYCAYVSLLHSLCLTPVRCNPSLYCCVPSQVYIQYKYISRLICPSLRRCKQLIARHHELSRSTRYQVSGGISKLSRCILYISWGAPKLTDAYFAGANLTSRYIWTQPVHTVRSLQVNLNQ